MKSVFHAAAFSAIVLCAAACSPSAPDQTAVAESEAKAEAKVDAVPSDEARCRAVIEHSRELRGLTDPALDDVIAAAIVKCAEEGKLTQVDYDCAMAAKTGDELTACHVTLR